MATQTKTTLPDATTSTFNADLQAFLRQEDADRYDDLFISHVVSGGTHSTGASLTQTPASLTAYCGGYYVTETGSITYPDDATHIYVIAHKDTTSAVTNWTRVTGTHYLFRTGTAAEPSLPDDSCWLMKVTTSSGSVTAVEDRRLRRPYPLHVSTSAPTSTDDDSKGFFVGFTWVDTSTDTIYQMADATTGAAVWDTVAGIASTLRDADGDTYIRTEQNADEDIIRFGVAGSEVGHWNSTRFKIEDTVEIHSSDNTISALHFGDPEDNDVGRIEYSHPGDLYRFYVGGAQKGRWDSTGLNIAGNDVAGDGPLHIGAGLAGSVAADFGAREGVFEGSGAQVGISILGSNTAAKKLVFGDPAKNDAAILNSNANDSFDLFLTGSIVYRMSNSIVDFNTSGADQDFRVRGNTLTNLLYVNAGTDNICLGSSSPDASALLDLVSTTKGMGLPSMTTAQRDAISSPRDGLIGHNSTTNTVDARLNGAWVGLATDISFGWTLLEHQTASADATIDMTTGIDSTYDVYKIVGVNIRPATDDVEGWLRLSDDGGSTFKSGASDYEWAVIGTRSGTNINEGNGADSQIRMAFPAQGAGYSVGNDATHGLSFELTLFKPSDSQFFQVVHGLISWRSANNNYMHAFLTGRYVTAAAINAWQFLFESGNITEGEFYTYGMRTS